MKESEKVVNPVDDTIISLDDLSIGKITKAQVVLRSRVPSLM